MINFGLFSIIFYYSLKYDVKLTKSLLFFLLNLTSGRKNDINLVRLTKEGEYFAKSNNNRSGKISPRKSNDK
jgi:hypothetical protein